MPGRHQGAHPVARGARERDHGPLRQPAEDPRRPARRRRLQGRRRLPSIANAARRFLDRPGRSSSRPRSRTSSSATSGRSPGSMTVEDMISDQDKFAQQVRDRCSQEMESFGLVIDSFQIQAITSPSDYIENLAVPHQAEVEQNARIARANADREAVAPGAGPPRRRSPRRCATRRSRRPASRPRSTRANQDAAQQGPLAAGDGAPGGRRGGDQGRRAPGGADGAAAPGRRAQARGRRGLPPDDARRGGTRRARSARPRRRPRRSGCTPRPRRPRRSSRRRPGRGAMKVQAEAQADATRLNGQAEADAIRARASPRRTRSGRGWRPRRPGIERRAAALSQNQEAVIAQQIAENLPEIVQAAASPFEHVGTFTVLNGAAGRDRRPGRDHPAGRRADPDGARDADAEARRSVERPRRQHERRLARAFGACRRRCAFGSTGAGERSHGWVRRRLRKEWGRRPREGQRGSAGRTRGRAGTCPRGRSLTSAPGDPAPDADQDHPAPNGGEAVTAELSPQALADIEAAAGPFVDGLVRAAPGSDAFRRAIGAIDRLGDREVRTTTRIVAAFHERPRQALGEVLAERAPLRHNLEQLNRTARDVEDVASDAQRRSPSSRRRSGARGDLRPRGRSRARGGRPGARQDNAELAQQEGALWAQILTLRRYAALAARLDDLIVERIASIEADDDSTARSLRDDALLAVRRRRRDLLLHSPSPARGMPPCA